MQIWLGLFTAGTQRTQSTPCEGASNLDLRKVSPTPLHLAVQRLDAHNKTITSKTGDVSFALHKASLPYKNNQYEWELTGSQGDYQNSIVLKHGGIDQVAALEQQDGTAVVTLQRGGFYTLNRFRWGSKTYRWTTSGCGDSRAHLQIKLMEDGSRQELARIEGPGSRCKSFWIQNPELSQDTISIFGRTDYPTWMQVVIASGMVAAKTQRRIDKSLQQQRM
ncbi:hypothetical protein WJX79_006245 [Trebouxia sp. C0005]